MTTGIITGIIDVGSNTVRLVIFKREGQNFEKLLNKGEVVGLAGFVESGSLSPKGVKKLCECLASFRTILRGFGVTDVHAFATASLRYVSNAPAIVERVQERTGISLELISGEEEARLSFLGARHYSGIENGMVVDIGGASCELVTVRGTEPLWIHSLSMGCLSLGLGRVAGIFASKREVKRMRDVVRQRLDAAPEQFGRVPETLCCVGGTARAVYRLSRELSGLEELENNVSGELDAKNLRRIVKSLANQERKAYHALACVAPDRLFTVLPGALILWEIVKRSGAKKITVVDGGLRDGYLLDKIIGAKRSETTVNIPALPMAKADSPSGGRRKNKTKTKLAHRNGSAENKETSAS
jgi:exopolyphosphatase/guanosine-5'-triphosphate,3'-diphosphate pyrophosphatase